MSSQMKNGGYAFPQPCIDNGHASNTEHGMTLRDYFAAKALGHIPDLIRAKNENASVYNIAKWAYKVADAMLECKKETDPK